MKYPIKIITLFIATLLAACSGSSVSPAYMVFDDVTYVGEFPQTFRLKDNIETGFDVIGIKSFVIHDSLLVLSTTDKSGLWAFFSLSGGGYLGSFLTQGQGPDEFITPPGISDKVRLFMEGGALLAGIYDFNKGRVLEMNVSESIREKKLCIATARDSLPPFLFNFVMVGGETILCKEMNHSYTQQVRYVLEKNNRRTTPDFLQRLNQASIKEGEDINILSTITKPNAARNLIVELPIGLNYINIYSPDGSFARTVCVGSKLYNIDMIQEKDRWDRIYTFADLRIFDGFFGVVCIDEDEKTFQTARKKLPSILFFDWQGKPLAELKLSRFITSFDIDFASASLYTLDVHSDEFYKYDIGDILGKI